MGIKARSMLF